MKALGLSWIVWLVSCIRFAACAQDYYSATAEMKARLMNTAVYDKTVRPKGNNSKPINIHSFIMPELISHVGLADESLEMTVLFCGRWKDERLSWKTWNVDEAVGQYIVLPVRDIWWPQLTLVNTYTEDFRLDRNDAVVVTIDGTVSWCTVTTAEVPCTMDMTNFPYDAHDCTLKFASLPYTDEELNFTTELVTETVGNVSSEWTIQNLSFKKGRVSNRTCLDLSLRLQRTGGNFVYMVKLPSVAVTLATLLIFWMPPSSDRRVTLGCLNLLVAMSMLQWLEWWIGASTAVPRVITFLGGTMLVQAVAIAFSVLDVNLTSTSMPCGPPGSLVRFLRGPVATFLCLSTAPAVSNSDGILQAEEDDRHGLSSPKEDLLKQQDWYLVAQGMDRLLFVVFAIALIVVHV